jgi:hypothetical protein
MEEKGVQQGGNSVVEHAPIQARKVICQKHKSPTGGILRFCDNVVEARQTEEKAENREHDRVIRKG